MFKLTLHDRKGTELKQGDIVKISDGKAFNFYSEVKYLNGFIYPFHSFTFHSFEKVDSVPTDAVKSTNKDYDVWYTNNPELDEDAKEFEGYLMSWRECERLLEKSVFRIELINNIQAKLF